MQITNLIPAEHPEQFEYVGMSMYRDLATGQLIDDAGFVVDFGNLEEAD